MKSQFRGGGGGPRLPSGSTGNTHRTMERVALFLQKKAIEHRKRDDFDVFGRSSFNRYYYAVFLQVRAAIREFEPQWQPVHSQTPGYLTGSIQRELSNFRSKSMRRGNADAVRVSSEGISAIQSLSDLLTRSYAVRVVADYQPEVRVALADGSRFTLQSTSINEAHSWPSEADRYLRVLRRAWRLARGL
jgi:hypothetical protein